jgi:hypothetical protein
MKNGLPSKLTKGEMDEFSAILGSAPVSSESERNYNALWEHLIVSCVPRDCMEVLLIRQCRTKRGKIMRYDRHQTIGIDRRFRQSLEFHAQRRKEQAAQSEVPAGKAAEKGGRPVTELGKMAQLKDVVVSSAEDDILPGGAVRHVASWAWAELSPNAAAPTLAAKKCARITSPESTLAAVEASPHN